MIGSGNADTSNFTFSGVQQKRFRHNTLHSARLNDLVTVRAFAHATLGGNEAQVGAAAVVLGAGISPAGVGLGVDRLNAHQVLVVDHQQSVVLTRELVCPFNGVLLPVGPVDVVAQHAQTEWMPQTAANDNSATCNTNYNDAQNSNTNT